MANTRKKFRFTVKPAENGQRLDSWLASKLPHFSRSQLAGQIKSGQVWIGGKIVQPNSIIRTGQSVTAEFNLPSTKIKPEQIDLDIIYQDADLIVINKSAGLVMHPAGSHTSGTLANALQHLFSAFYLVHRLDKDTSGVMVVARNLATKHWLSKLFEERRITKTYLALVKGRLTPTEAYLDLPIKRGKSGKFEAGLSGRSAKSFYRVKEYLPGFTLVEVYPQTGRTHQIRVHFQALNHPVAGDTMYGVAERGLTRQFLHAYKLEFMDRSGQTRKFTAPLLKELDDFLKELRNKV